LHVRLYPVCVIGGLIVWMLVTGRIWKRGGGDPIEAMWVCVMAAPAALLGARFYSAITDALRGAPSSPFDFSQGGLGIYGAIAGGVAAIVIACRARGWPLGTFLDCAVPGLALGQAVGRFGNWFNEELYGGPTSLPWGMYVSPDNRPLDSLDTTHYHPTFLYEAIWDVTVALVLLAIWGRVWKRYRPGALAAIYLLLYAVGRFLIEGLRIDPATTLGPLRLNQAVSLFVMATAIIVLTQLDRKRPPRRR
jgi:prolipoprotein diacylglyceryl transferase